jgi:hypothetical protein
MNGIGEITPERITSWTLLVPVISLPESMVRATWTAMEPGGLYQAMGPFGFREGYLPGGRHTARARGFETHIMVGPGWIQRRGDGRPTIMVAGSL